MKKGEMLLGLIIKLKVNQSKCYCISPFYFLVLNSHKMFVFTNNALKFDLINSKAKYVTFFKLIMQS